MGKNFWIILSVAVVAIIGGVAVFGKKDEAKKTTSPITNPLTIQKDDLVQGKGKVTLIEYGDFECPGCGLLYPWLKQLKTDYKDKFTFVFRHFPLVSLHQNAMAAHRAAQAAANQDKFWEMHDRLYETQNEWRSSKSAPTVFESYAKDLGLNIEKYKKDAAGDEVFAFINRHVDSGSELEITGTPTLYLNGEKLETPGTYDQLKKIMDEAIKEAK